MTVEAANNQRGRVRPRVLKTGKIVLNHDWSVIDCTIRDLTELGARLRCSDQVAVPAEFKLLVPSLGTVRPARAVWRSGADIGVVFTGEAKPAPPRKW